MLRSLIEKPLKKHFGHKITLELPPNRELGDFALPCFEFAAKFKKSPIEIAKDLAEELEIKNVKTIANGPYLNFYVDKEVVARLLIQSILDADFFKIKKGKKKIVMDYSAPNVAKHMGIHNLRSTIIGQSCANIHRYLGYDVVGINYIGDWGTNFGQLIYAARKWSSVAKIKEKGVVELNRVYVKFNTEADKKPELKDEAKALFAALENGDKEAKKLWELFFEVSMKDYNRIYERLGVEFDLVKGEAAAVKGIPKLMDTLKEKKLSKVDDGAIIVDVGDDVPPCLVAKNDGASTYATRDLVTMTERFEKYKPDQILYFTDVSQRLHFQQIFTVMNKIKKGSKDKLVNAWFGRLKFPDKKMSTRKGQIIVLEEVLDEAAKKVLKIIEEKNPKLKGKKQVAEDVGIGAVIYNDLIHDRTHDLIFTWDKVLDFEGDSGPYVQYAHARCCSILEKYGKKCSTKVEFALITEDNEISLIKELARFESVLLEAKNDLKPSFVARYVLSVAKMFNAFYRTSQIITTDDDTTKARILLTHMTKITLERGLELLSMKAPEEM